MWLWRRLLRVPWTARWSNKSILKEINPEYSLEGLMMKLTLQYFGHLMQKTVFTGKEPDAGKDGRQEEKGMKEDEIVGWHHWLSEHEFEQTQGYSERQGSLVCHSPWGCKDLDMTEWLYNNQQLWIKHPRIKPVSPALACRFFTMEPPWKPKYTEKSHRILKLIYCMNSLI